MEYQDEAPVLAQSRTSVIVIGILEAVVENNK